MNGPLLRAVRPRLAIPGSADAGVDQAIHGERHGDRDPAERELEQAREEHRPAGQAAHGHATGQQRDGGEAGWSNGTGPVRVVPQPAPQSYTLDAEGYVDVTVPSGLQANSSFNITLSANDGTTTQSESVLVQIKASCQRHY